MDARTEPQHPAPHRGRTSLTGQLVSLAAGPAAWALFHLVGYGLASYACFPGDEPRLAPLPGWDGLRLWVALAGLGALAVTALAGWFAFRSYRSTREESGKDLLETGAGRSRFLAMSGMIVSGLFVAAILFDAIMLAGAPLCRD